jgi:hypothetical protein
MLSGSAFRTSSSTNVVPPRAWTPAKPGGGVQQSTKNGAPPVERPIALGAEPSRVFPWFESYQGASASLYDHV